jgi:uncharacterized phage protein (TIGR01671 family)
MNTKREILFRGKRIDNGEWVYGDLLNYCMGQKVIREFGGKFLEFKVHPETLGQFIGLLDKNKVKIFEDDIALVEPLGYDENKKINPYGKYKEIVRYKLMNENYDKEAKYSGFLEYRCVPFNHSYQSIEIIGNIHDNAELLNKDK